MTDTTNFRMERIEKLLHELRYEVERGMLEKDIDETIGYRFYVPLSRAIPDGVVFCKPPRCEKPDCPGAETFKRFQSLFFHETPTCEHNFQGWREFEDGHGGEKVCTKCGVGAMGWSMRVGP